MKKLKYIIYTFAVTLIMPSLAFGSTSGGSNISSDVEALQAIESINDFLTGPILLGLGTLFAILAFIGIMKSKANDNRAWEWMGRICIGLIGATAAASLLQTVFGGGTI